LLLLRSDSNSSSSGRAGSHCRDGIRHHSPCNSIHIYDFFSFSCSSSSSQGEKIKARKKNPRYRKILVLLLQQNSPRHLRDGEEESRCAANPRAGAGDAAKTLRVTKGRDDGARETDEDKIW
jgi:hypothetical protein